MPDTPVPSEPTKPFKTFEEFNEEWHEHVGFGKKALSDTQLRELADEQPQFTAKVAATDAALFFGPMPTKFRALAEKIHGGPSNGALDSSADGASTEVEPSPVVPDKKRGGRLSRAAAKRAAAAPTTPVTIKAARRK